jgi:hypothetical protein
MKDLFSLRKYSKYGFIVSVSAFLSFLASENPSMRPIMLYLWVAVTAIAVMASLWKVERNTDEGIVVDYLLSMADRLDAVIILSLVVAAVMLGLN